MSIVFALLAIWSLPNLAIGGPLDCPQPITIQESLGQTVPIGWTQHDDASPRYLGGVTFFDGDPSQNRSIAPTHDLRSGRDHVAVWSFGSSGEPVWLNCRYLDTGISLSKQIPTAYKECRVTYGAGGVVKSIYCKQ